MNVQTPVPQLVTAREAMRMLCVSHSSFYRLRLPAIRLGRQTVRYSLADIEAAIASRREERGGTGDEPEGDEAE